MLNGKQLSSLKKILKSVGLQSIAAMASQEEIRETLKNMKQSYKDMILMNSDVSEKYKNILSAFMS